MTISKTTPVSIGLMTVMLGGMLAIGMWVQKINDRVEPIPQMQQDIATIKAIITANPMAAE